LSTSPKKENENNTKQIPEKEISIVPSHRIPQLAICTTIGCRDCAKAADLIMPYD
jgi:hypothetical protein